jgi:phospholipase C
VPIVHLRPSRRDVLRAGLIGGGAVAARGLSPALAQAIAATQPSCGTLVDIQHIVILIQENRSFDHDFGRYKGVRGYNDRSVRMSAHDDGTRVFRQAYRTRQHPGCVGSSPPLPHRHRAAVTAAGRVHERRRSPVG